MGEEIRVITREEVRQRLKDGSAVVINILSRKEYDEIHIKGSISIPYDLLENGELDAIGNQRNVITYCKSYDCGASMGAARILKEKGYNAMVYGGGIREWEQSGMPVEGSKVNRS